MHLFFPRNPLLRTSQRTCWGTIMGLMTSWEVSQAACERRRNTPERLVVICGASQQSLKPLLVRPAIVRGRGVTEGVCSPLAGTPFVMAMWHFLLGHPRLPFDNLTFCFSIYNSTEGRFSFFTTKISEYTLKLVS